MVATHWHADHFLGTFGPAQTLSFMGRTEPLTLYGPPGVHEFAGMVRQLSRTTVRFPIESVELRGGSVVQFGGYAVHAFATLHGIQSLGFVLAEDGRPGRFDREKAVALGVRPGPLFGRLQRGEPVRVTRDGVEVEVRPGEVVAVGGTVDELRVGDRVVVHAHLGCRRCENCIRGQYTTCLNYGNPRRGHRANGFVTNGGLAEYAVNHINTLHRIPDNVSYDEAVVVMTAGSPLFGLQNAGGYFAGETVAVLGAGSIGLMALQLAKALGPARAILTDVRDSRLKLGAALGAEGIAKDAVLLIGNGYVPGHAERTLGLLRRNAALRALLERRYARP